MTFTITTPNQSAELNITLFRGRARMECSFWPLAQIAFFREFERMYEVQQVSATPTRIHPAAGTVHFCPTLAQRATLIEDIESLFSELYEY